ncbi:GNAT family N-acetyltransferase [Desulfobacter latus]|uniref:N-acetyltransferase n=1 Tax=Desulfobacter latus TaxID=2292 RepID=A0A850SUB3_9BACT|nr:N-acetyltransferase [Desulfobacter latus]NWH03600.1 N-acetyltransferase [Desulfobacter latus]
MKYQILKTNCEEEIKQLFTDVFTESETPAEGTLIGNLVEELQKTTKPEDIFCFVAIDKNKIIASIFFTRFTTETNLNAFILSPVAVATQHQKKGIGQNLIKFAIDYLKQNNVELLLTYGDPDFYSKVSFKNISEEIIKAPLKLTYPNGWLAQSLISENVSPVNGSTMCVKALMDQKYW